MNERCIATFFSHFGAIRFKKWCESAGLSARLSPVPRTLSSSCGTCVRVEGEPRLPDRAILADVEQIVRETEGGYELLYRAEDS